jgi:Carboxypeptidase regulatory-like domain
VEGLQELRKLLAFAAMAAAIVLAALALWPRGGGQRRVLASGDGGTVERRAADADGGSAPEARGGTVEGRVVDGDGRPIAGARVEAAADDGAPLGATGASPPPGARFEPAGELGLLHGPIPYPPARPWAGGIVTDGRGEFRMSGVRAGRVVVSAWHPDFQRGSAAPIDLPEGWRVTVQVVLARAPAAPMVEEEGAPRGAGHLGGTVVDDRGFPVEGARVEAQGRGALSDHGGHFALEGLSAGPFLVRVTHADFAPAETRLAESDDVQLQLLPGGGLDGEVRDPVTGRLPPGATLELVAGGRTRPVALGQDGRFEATGLLPGRVELVAHAPGYSPARLGVEVPAGERPREVTARDVTIELSRGGVVVGSVRGQDGDPVVGAEVSAGSARGRSDERGEFRLEGVAPGGVTVRARAGGHRAESETEVRSDEESRVDLELR